MDNRKRPRLEVPSNVRGRSATLSSIGQQSLLLSNDSATDAATTINVNSLPANVFLTICNGDDESDESQDFIAIDSSTLAAHIKQEQDLQSLPLQYRIVNQLPQRQAQPSRSAASTRASATTLMSEQGVTEVDGMSASPLNSSAAALALPASVQLPRNCEIYVVNHDVNSNTAIGELLTTSPFMAGTNIAPTTIKLEPVTRVTPLGNNTATVGSKGNEIGFQILRNKSAATNAAPPKIASTTAAAGSAVLAEVTTEASSKRSFILEAYKKRDDRRRATHNEVERRRRDKINNWIFKLKEMLPIDGNIQTSPTIPVVGSKCGMELAISDNAEQQQLVLARNQQHQSPSQLQRITNNVNGNSGNSSNRTPPSDSKSQILIKACEYIKTIQDENKRLRECLTENEQLRVSNQRLQSELHQLRNEQHYNHKNSNVSNSSGSCRNSINSKNIMNSSGLRNNNINLTLNTLNTSFFGATAVAGTTATFSGNGNGITSTSEISSDQGGRGVAGRIFAKRQLIIRDYVD